MGKVKSINQYRLTPGFGGFTPVPYTATKYRLTCAYAHCFELIGQLIPAAYCHTAVMIYRYPELAQELPFLCLNSPLPSL